MDWDYSSCIIREFAKIILIHFRQRDRLKRETITSSKISSLNNFKEISVSRARGGSLMMSDLGLYQGLPEEIPNRNLNKESLM